MQKTAITEDIVILVKNNRKLRRQTSLVPSEEFLQYGLRLLTRIWPERKAHEIAVSHEFGETSYIFFSEWAQN
jgi:hypothetical protein